MQFIRLAGCFLFALVVNVTSADARPQANNRATENALRLPNNYRTLIAKFALLDYAKLGLSHAEYSEKRTKNSIDFCLQYQIKKMSWIGEKTTGTQIRSQHYTLARDIIFHKLKLVGMSGSNFDVCSGPTKPFPELTRLGREVKACRAKGGGDCGVDGFTLPRAVRELENAP